MVIYILKFGGERISGYQVYIGSVPPEEMVCDFGAAGMAGGDLGGRGRFFAVPFQAMEMKLKIVEGFPETIFAKVHRNVRSDWYGKKPPPASRSPPAIPAAPKSQTISSANTYLYKFYLHESWLRSMISNVGVCGQSFSPGR